MTRRFVSPLLWALLLSAPATAAAQVTSATPYTPADDTQAIRVGAVIFYDYTFQSTPKSTDAASRLFPPNSFMQSTPRAYINITGNISHMVLFRITPDISRESGSGASLAGSLEYRTKYAYAQVNFDDWTGNWKQTWARLGIQQTPWLDYMEGIYRYRFQGTLFAEREGFITSSDAGASLHTNFPSGFGDFHIGVYNGEGYSKTEVNQTKALQMRAAFRPLARSESLLARGWRVAVFLDQDSYLKDAPRKRFIFNTTFEHAHVNLGFDFMKTQDQTTLTGTNAKGSGWTFFVTPFFKEKGNGLEALIRYDALTPNTAAATATQAKQRLIAGIAYWFAHPGGAATAAWLLDYEQLVFANFPAAAANAKQQRIALHGLINF